MSALRELLNRPLSREDEITAFIQENWPFDTYTRPNGKPSTFAKHFSFSSLAQYDTCREQMRQSYILGIKRPPVGYLMWGTADHKALDVNWAQKVESHEDLPVADVQEAFADALDATVAEEEEKSGQATDWGGGSLADMKDRGVELVTAYHRVASPQVQPITPPEQEFWLEIPGIPVPINGYIDVEQEGSVLDRKGKGRKIKVPDLKDLMQGRVYQLVRPKPVIWHVSAKTKIPGIYTPQNEPGLQAGWSQEFDRATVRWIRSTVYAIVADFHQYGPDNPWPGQRSLRSQANPCGSCGYKPTCPWWQS